MWFKHRAWIPVAWLLAAANLVGVWFAARPGETWHATAHALFAAAFAVGGQRLMARRRLAASDDLQQALDDNERLQEMLASMQPRMHELEERLEFAERVLATHRQAERPGPPPA